MVSYAKQHDVYVNLMWNQMTRKYM